MNGAADVPQDHARSSVASAGERQAVLDGAHARGGPCGPLGQLTLAPDVDAPVEDHPVALDLHADRVRILGASLQGREDPGLDLCRLSEWLHGNEVDDVGDAGQPT